MAHLPETPRELLLRALEADDLASIEAVARAHPAVLNEPRCRPAAVLARSVAAAERLVRLGADLDLVSQWWAPGFSTREVRGDVGRFLVEKGATVTPHAAAGLGLTDHLAEMLAGDSRVVDAKGGDGCTPLHFSRDIATADLLLRHGARLDARDEDHDSTPAQWLIGDVPEVARFLLERGAAPDLFLAAALGDGALAARLIERDPGCLAHRIGKLPEFPPLGDRHRGGTIYQWTLGFNCYAHQIALMKGHEELFTFLYERSDTATRLLVSCVLARRAEAQALVAANPGLVSSLPAVDHELVARYCWETNTNYDAVKLMLDVGFPLAHPERSHGYTPLHNAAWAGSADLVELLLERGHPVDLVDPRYQATALDYALHDCLVERRHPEGEFGRVVSALIQAGSPWNALDYPTGEAQLDEVLEPLVRGRVDGAALLGDEPALDRLLGAEPGPASLSEALAGAAKGGHAALCRRLLEAGAAVNGATGPNRVPPLLYAACSGSTGTVEALLQSGAEIKAKNGNQSTVLHMAVAHDGGLEVVSLLLRSGGGGQIEVRNKFGKTPLQMAEERGLDEIVGLFRQFQAE